MNTMITSYVENKEDSEFYPTPKNLVEKMLCKVNWDSVHSILEPSAGKGDILRGVARKLSVNSRKNDMDVDYIEIDGNLRSIIKHRFSEAAKDSLCDRRKEIVHNGYAEKDYQTGRYKFYDHKTSRYCFFTDEEQKMLEQIDYELDSFFNTDNIHLVHDDFLTYTAYKQYDLIIMNPPFSEGDKHLLKALDMQKHGGQVVCLLNAETIRNPYTETRKSLVALLNEYNAEITYIDDAFKDAERRADVDVALISVNVPKVDDEMSIFEKLAKAKEYDDPIAEEITDLEVTDFIKAIVNRYRIEVESGIELIRTYQRMLPYLRSSIGNKEEYGRTYLIELTDGNGSYVSVNSYVKAVRRKYWKALLTNPKFVGKLTEKLQREYSEKVYSFSDYDFSEFNIYSLVAEMNAQIKSGIENEIEAMYDRLTEEHSYYPECQKNKHLYNGWKTNKAWKIDKKCILPCYGVFSNWDGEPRSYEAYKVLADIERILNFFDGNMTASVDMNRQLNGHFAMGITKNIKCKFFEVTFYKKGTVHIKFTCPELIDRYNIYVAQNRKWLPPSYGTKQYSAMTSEEQAVIDSFQGEDNYRKVMERSDYYLASPIMQSNVLALTDNAS